MHEKLTWARPHTCTHTHINTHTCTYTHTRVHVHRHNTHKHVQWDICSVTWMWRWHSPTSHIQHIPYPQPFPSIYAWETILWVWSSFLVASDQQQHSLQPTMYHIIAGNLCWCKLIACQPFRRNFVVLTFTSPSAIASRAHCAIV